MGTIIFYEGNLDNQLLNKVVQGLSDTTLVRANSKFGMASFMQGYESNGGVLSPENPLGFRDRDFDFPVPDHPGLIETRSSKIVASYRTTIENYLLDAATLAAFVSEKKLEIPELANETQTQDFLNQLATELTPYSAVRHALGASRIPALLKTTWKAQSGKLPDSLEEEDCRQAGIQLISNYQTAVQQVSVPQFEVYLEEFKATFDENFIQNRDYLIYFHGKDIQALFSKKLQPVNFSFKSYYDFAIQRFDFTIFPDLVELRKRIIEG